MKAVVLFLSALLGRAACFHVCSTFPFCLQNSQTGFWQPMSDLNVSKKNVNASSLQKDVAFRSPDCWFKDKYCRSDASNTVQTLELDNPEDCQSKCQALDECLFFTFHKTRGQGKCSLLNKCTIHTRCSSQSNCASGQKFCTCPKLDLLPANRDKTLYARWKCGELNPYTSNIPVGMSCSTSCPAWKGIGEKPHIVQSTCLPSGQWSITLPASGSSLGYTGSYSTPDQPDMVCGCQEVGPFSYDPNSEDGATFVCKGWGGDHYKKTGGWSITTSDRCDLYCNNEPTPVVSVYCDDDTSWHGEPELGFWCYKQPEDPRPQKQKGGEKDKVDGQWSKWTVAGSCSTTCGEGLEIKKRQCDSPAPTNGGKQCVNEGGQQALTEEKKFACKIKECPVDCVVSEWASWGRCSKTCGVGKRQAIRKVAKQPLHGGKQCPALIVTEKCSTNPCPIDCKVGAWGSCSKTCGGGVRSKVVITQAQHGGKPCPKVETCNTHSCGELLYSNNGVKYYKIPVPFGRRMVDGAVATTCEEHGMKAVCAGPSRSKCPYYSDRCRVTPLSGTTCDHMHSLAKLICNGNNPRKCPKINGMFQDMFNWNGSDCGVVDGVHCAYGKDFVSQSNKRLYAYCVL